MPYPSINKDLARHTLFNSNPCGKKKKKVCGIHVASQFLTRRDSLRNDRYIH